MVYGILRLGTPPYHCRYTPYPPGATIFLVCYPSTVTVLTPILVSVYQRYPLPRRRTHVLPVETLLADSLISGDDVVYISTDSQSARDAIT